MTELETLERARMYLENLAKGISPLDGTVIADTDIVNNVRISRCFFYVSDVLRQIIENGGIAPQQKASKEAFCLTPEQRTAFAFSATPIPISEITKRINALRSSENMDALRYTAIRNWLCALGMLEDAGEKAFRQLQDLYLNAYSRKTVIVITMAWALTDSLKPWTYWKIRSVRSRKK